MPASVVLGRSVRRPKRYGVFLKCKKSRTRFHQPQAVTKEGKRRMALGTALRLMRDSSGSFHERRDMAEQARGFDETGMAHDRAGFGADHIGDEAKRLRRHAG